MGDEGIERRAFAERQRITSLPESELQSTGWANLKAALRVWGVLGAPDPSGGRIPNSVFSIILKG